MRSGDVTFLSYCATRLAPRESGRAAVRRPKHCKIAKIAELWVSLDGSGGGGGGADEVLGSPGSQYSSPRPPRDSADSAASLGILPNAPLGQGQAVSPPPPSRPHTTTPFPQHISITHTTLAASIHS